MSSNTADNSAAAGSGNGESELINAILQSINGTIDYANIAKIMGISTPSAAGKRVKRFCDKQVPIIPCSGAILGTGTGTSNADGGAAPKTPRGKKTAGDGAKTTGTAKTAKRKSVSEVNGDEADGHVDGEDAAVSKKVTKAAAKTTAAGSDNEAEPTSPGPKTPKKKATPKPRTPKATTAKAPKSPKAPKHPTKATEEEDGDEAMKDEISDAEDTKTEMKKLKGMDIDVFANTGSPAKKAKMTTTVAAAVEEAKNEELEV